MELTIKDIKKLMTDGNNADYSWLVGKSIFTRTCTYHYTGRVKEIKGQFLVLEKAAWIADSGMFHNALKKEEFGEVEPYINDVYVNIDSIVDFTCIGKLPREQK